ncbi:MAG: hypothetical protein F6K17_28335 [Okeania sp. SIO3C4]|nr:hypothetical protein [Okeania sp. SIO3C4]
MLSILEIFDNLYSDCYIDKSLKLGNNFLRNAVQTAISCQLSVLIRGF